LLSNAHRELSPLAKDTEFAAAQQPWRPADESSYWDQTVTSTEIKGDCESFDRKTENDSDNESS